MKVELNNKLSSLLTEEVGSIIRKIITNGAMHLQNSALALVKNYSGKRAELAIIFSKPEVHVGELLQFFSSFEKVEINDSGYIRIRTKGWETPINFKYYSGIARLYLGEGSVLPNEVIWNLPRGIALELECILRNQHPLSNESQL